MKAIVYSAYGGPEVLRLEEVAKPVPRADEVLIRVRAASVNAADWRLLRGKPRLWRLESGVRAPKHRILGADIAGSIETVGTNVQAFQPGDGVFGDLSGCGLGGFAEFVAVPETAVVAKPLGVSFEEAAAVPMAAVTALQGLRDRGHIQPDQTVLIHGASGGVGSFAVQLAAWFETEVTGVCTTHKAEFVRSIGADHVIDYTREDFTRMGRQYDLIVDAVGNRSVADLKRALTPEGTCVIAGFSTFPRWFEHLVIGAWVSRTGRRTIGPLGLAKPRQEHLEFISELLEGGVVAPAVDKQFPLNETADAIRYLEGGHARGKVVISVTSDRDVERPTGGWMTDGPSITSAIRRSQSRVKKLIHHQGCVFRMGTTWG